MFSKHMCITAFLLSLFAGNIVAAAESSAEHSSSSDSACSFLTDALIYFSLKKIEELFHRDLFDVIDKFAIGQNELNRLWFLGACAHACRYDDVPPAIDDFIQNMLNLLCIQRKLALDRKYDDIPWKLSTIEDNYRKYAKAELYFGIELELNELKLMPETKYTLLKRLINQYNTIGHLEGLYTDPSDLKHFFFIRSLQARYQQKVDTRKVASAIDSAIKEVLGTIKTDQSESLESLRTLTLTPSNTELDTQLAAFQIPLDRDTRTYILYEAFEKLSMKEKKKIMLPLEYLNLSVE